MKHMCALLILFLSLSTLAQQPPKDAIEARTKELVRVISLCDKEAYRKFIKANYTEALINRKMRMRVEGGPGPAAAPEGEKSDPLEEKVNMYARIHNDLGEGKIISMKQNDDKLEVEVQGSTGLSPTFVLTFLRTTPYLIDGFSVQIVMGK